MLSWMSHHTLWWSILVGKLLLISLIFFSLNKLKFTNEMNTISIENYHIKGYFFFTCFANSNGSTWIINVRLNFIVHSSKSKQIHNLNQFHHFFLLFLLFSFFSKFFSVGNSRFVKRIDAKKKYSYWPWTIWIDF